MIRRLFAFALVFAIGVAFPVLAAAQSVSLTQTTATYKLTLVIGPLETMLTPDQAKGATSGEVMVQMVGMAMPSMSMTDQGQPVNHHLEVHLYNKTTGAVISNQLPTIWITNQANGATRQLSSAMGMYGVAQGMSDFHVGNNVYLPDGTYKIAVQLGSETATFVNVAVSGASAPAAAPMAAPAAMPMPATLPQTGDAPRGALVAIAAFGLGLVAIGRRLQNRGHDG